MSFSDMLLVTFRDNSFVKGVVPILNDMMAPLIQNAIQSAVRSAVDDMKTSVLDKLIETNEALQKTVSDQSETIKRQKILIDTQAREIDSKIAKVTELEGEVQLLTDELDNMKMSLNDLEQYGRRNSLRINNLKLNYNGEEPDLTRAVVNFLNSVVLIDDKDGFKLAASDVERCHPLGRINRAGNRQILVKFKSYHSKSKVFAAKSKLKGNPDNIFISEDLTGYNHTIVKSLLQFRKNKQIDSLWTLNGRIFAKKSRDDDPTRVRSLEDVFDKLNVQRVPDTHTERY